MSRASNSRVSARFLPLFCPLTARPLTPTSSRTHPTVSVTSSSSQNILKQETNLVFSFSFLFALRNRRGVLSADQEICKHHTAPLGRPGGEIRPKLPDRKKEEFSPSLFSLTELRVRGQNVHIHLNISTAFNTPNSSKSPPFSLLRSLLDLKTFYNDR